MKLLDMLINKTVGIAIDKGIIKSKSIIVDTTHTKARYNQKFPKQILMDRSKKLRKSVYEIDENMREKFPRKATTDVLEDEIEYCQKKRRYNIKLSESKREIKSSKRDVG